MKDLFSQILQCFNAQNCKVHIENTVPSLKNIALNLVLDHEKCGLSNVVDFFYKTVNLDIPF